MQLNIQNHPTIKEIEKTCNDIIKIGKTHLPILEFRKRIS